MMVVKPNTWFVKFMVFTQNDQHILASYLVYSLVAKKAFCLKLNPPMKSSFSNVA